MRLGGVQDGILYIVGVAAVEMGGNASPIRSGLIQVSTAASGSTGGAGGTGLALLIEILPSPSLLRGSSAFSLLGQIRRVSSLGARRGRASSRRAGSVRISISSARRKRRDGDERIHRHRQSCEIGVQLSSRWGGPRRALGLAVYLQIDATMRVRCSALL